MLIKVRITNVDMDGYCGRDLHPTKDMEGQVCRVVGMGILDEESALEFSNLAKPPNILYNVTDEAVQVFIAVLPTGRVVELVEHEVQVIVG